MDLTAVPGQPETALGPELVSRLPLGAPRAPWPLELRALLWFGHARPGLGEGLAPRLRHRSRGLLSGGALIHYLDTPVGPYAEALAATVLLRDGRPGVHVPFMAVDSLDSLVGGRTNWSLPKTLARFEGSPGTDGAVRARGEGWDLGARVRPLGPAFPFRAPLTLLQEWPDGAIRPASGRLSGRARLAWVRVEASARPELRRLLGAGTRPGVIVEHARGTLGAAGEPEE